MQEIKRIAILAGGRSQRMGANKARLMFDDKILLSRLVEDAHKLELKVNVCADNLRYPEILSDPKIVYSSDLLPNKSGALSAIQPVLEEAYQLGEKWLWVYACDSLIRPSEMLSYFESAFNQIDLSKDDVMMILPKSDKLLPLMGLYRTSLCEDLKEYLYQGNRRVMSFCNDYKIVTLPIPSTVKHCCNFNTPYEFDLGKHQYCEHLKNYELYSS